MTQPPPSSMPSLQPFTPAHAPSVVKLLAAEGWDTYTVDPERTARALSAPGCTTLLAFDGTRVVALVQLQSDSEIHAHLSALLGASPWRGRGLGRHLVHEALTRAGGIHVDELTRNRGFYESLGGQPRPGFRLSPEQLKPRQETQPSNGDPAGRGDPALRRHDEQGRAGTERFTGRVRCGT